MTPAEFRAAIPAFANEPDGVIQRHIDRSPPYFNIARWGAFYVDGLTWWLAHEIVMETYENSLGVIGASAALAAEKRVGQVQVRYSEKLLDLEAENPYMRTVYGRKYVALLRKVGIGGVVV